MHFENATGIDIIFSRVTGRTRSSIDGTLSANGTADLFLINPNGIVFGQNASLDIGGSFIGTTAESLVFEDGTQFSTIDLTTAPLLTMNTPTGLQMGDNPGHIRQAGGTLQTTAGQTLALVGGDVTLSGGTLEVPGGRGRIDLISLGTDASVNLRGGHKWRVDISEADQCADLTLRYNALVLGTENGGVLVKRDLAALIGFRRQSTVQHSHGERQRETN